MSIFEDQLKFEPLTAKRRLMLKAELALYALLILLCFVPFVAKCLSETLVSPLLQPFGLYIRDHIVPMFSAQFGPILDSIGMQFGPWYKEFCHNSSLIVHRGFIVLARIFCNGLCPFGAPLLLLAYHNGFFGGKSNKREQGGVLATEFRRFWILHFGPVIKLTVKKQSFARELAGTALLFISCLLGFFWLASGLFIDWIPGYLFKQSSHGVLEWMVACVRDARFHVPQGWESYMSQESERLWQLSHMAQSSLQHKLIYFFDWNHSFLKPAAPMPVDLLNLRLFIAAIASFSAAIPLTMVLAAAGLDDFVFRVLRISPTKIEYRSGLFYGLIQNSRKFAWTDLLSVEQAAGKDGRFILKFRGSKTLQLDLCDFEEKNVPLFFQAIDELATGCKIPDEIRQKYMAECQKDSSVGYTLFWEEALSSRRKSTVFVPLTDGDVLANGRVVIQRQLAGQGWSATYLGRYNDRAVVLRESHLSHDSEHSKKAAEMLQRESEILLKLRHDGIAEVIDSFVENGRNYLVLEYVPGRDLRQHVGFAGALPQTTVVKFALQICSILEYLHNQDPPVVHRDLSPDNIVLSEKGTIRLIDFGASKQSIETATGTLIGKQAFMAPEQLRGKADAKSDIYAFAATLHWLLTASEPVALSQSHPGTLVSNLSPLFDELIAEMTSFDSGSRPDIGEVRRRLEQIPVEDEPSAVISLARKMSEICHIAATPWKQLREEAKHE